MMAAHERKTKPQPEPTPDDKATYDLITDAIILAFRDALAEAEAEAANADGQAAA